MPQTCSTGTATRSGAMYKAPDSQAKPWSMQKHATSSVDTEGQEAKKKKTDDSGAAGVAKQVQKGCRKVLR